MPTFVAIAMILLLLLAGCQEADPNAEIYGALGYLPTFESVECQFDVPSGHKAECGHLTIPDTSCLEELTSPDVR